MDFKPILLLLIVGFLLVGCIQQPPAEEPTVPEQPEEQPEQVEEVVTLEPSIEWVSTPSEVEASQEATFKWRIENAEGTITETKVYFGKVSVPSVDEETAPEDTAYTGESDEFVGSFEVPNEFTTTMMFDEPGTYYARVHTVIDGKHVWSDEVTFEVSEGEGPVKRSFTVNIGGDFFEPSEITVKKGDEVSIHFIVGEEGVPEAGVRIVSPAWEGPVLKPGDTFDATFTAEESFEFRLFWLAGNLLRATGTVNVEE